MVRCGVSTDRAFFLRPAQAEAVRTFSKARDEAAEMQGKAEAVSLLVELKQPMLKLWSWLTSNQHSGFYVAYQLTISAASQPITRSSRHVVLVNS